MSMTKKVVIATTADGVHALSSPYDPAIVEACRDYGMQWNPSDRVWTTHSASSAQKVAHRLRASGFPVEMCEAMVPATRLRAAELRIATLQRQLDAARRASRSELLRELLAEFGLPAYRGLTKVIHPDAPGGSHEWAQELNTAWDAVRRNRSA